MSTSKINILTKHVLTQVKKTVCPHHSPSLIILGAQKAGTSSLFQYLRLHPEIRPAVTKEVCYFSHRVGQSIDLKEYQVNFPGRRGYHYIEATPEYLYYPGVAAQICQILPNVKMVALLREPISRAYSAWNHYSQFFQMKGWMNKRRIPRKGHYLFDALFRDRNEFPSFAECIRIELEFIESSNGYEPALLRRGLYLEQLEEYWKHFPREQIQIVGFRDLAQDTQNTLNRVTEFLDLPPIEAGADSLKPVHQRAYGKKVSAVDRQTLEAFYQVPNRSLFEEIGPINW